jgi:hypothetical protein
VRRTAKHFDKTDAADDKAYPIHRNTETVESFSRTPHIPSKTDTVPPKDDLIWAKMYYVFMCYRQLSSQHYHKRSNVGSVLAMVKGRFKDFARFKSDDGGQVNEEIA